MGDNMLELKKARLKMYLDAERAILEGAQSYQIADRVLTRADLKYVQSVIADLMVELSTENLKSGRTKRITFLE